MGTAGYTGDKYCKDCGKLIETGKTEAANGHSWSKWSSIIEATCEHTGEEARTCSVCNKKETRTLSILPHNLTRTAAVGASCTAEGNTEYWYCSMCNRYFSNAQATIEIQKADTIIARKPHQLSRVEAKDPGCETAGNIEYWSCAVCGKFFDSDNEPNELPKSAVIIKATGHKWGDWAVVTEPSVNSEGKKERECSACGLVETVIIPRLTPDTPSDTSDTSDTLGTGNTPSAAPGTTGIDGTPVGKGASVRTAEKAITGMMNDNDPAGTVFSILALRSTKQTKNAITLKWSYVPGAVKYYIYGNKCGTANRMMRQNLISGTSLKVTSVIGNDKASTVLKKGTYYKFIVVAADSNDKVISTSKVIHVSTKGGKTGNYKSVKTKAKKNKVSLKVGKSFKLKAKGVPQVKKLKVKVHRKITYETTDSRIATVSAKGVIKGVNKGSCLVYAYSQSGTYAKIKVTVK